MRLRSRWRRFRARPKLQPVVPLHPVAIEHRPAAHISDYHSAFAQAEQEIARQISRVRTKRWRQSDLSQLEDLIHNQRVLFESEGSFMHGLVLTALQAPRAVRAQRHMDKHPGDNHNHKASLYELIDFNDTYVETVLACPEALLPIFNDQLKYLIDRLCKQLRTPSFSNEQYEAITYGLGREIAVYRGAINEGLDAEMTSNSQDAMGVDMVISDPETNRSINADVKTRSSFHFRVKDLVREGRLTQADADRAEQVGFCPITNGHGGEAVNVVLVRVDPEALGDIINFAFENSDLLGKELRRIINEFGYESKDR